MNKTTIALVLVVLVVSFAVGCTKKDNTSGNNNEGSSDAEISQKINDLEQESDDLSNEDLESLEQDLEDF